jgi:hypothetical protein
LHGLLPLRPCDFAFEPDPALPLGLGCLYAQVRSCAAPCLSRISEEAYRDLARSAEQLLLGCSPRPEALTKVLPDFVAPAGSRGLVATSNPEEVELYPVRGGAVLEVGAVRLGRAALAEAGVLDAALGALVFDAPAPLPDDLPWLLQWILGPRKGGVYVTGPDLAAPPTLAARLRAVLT